MLLTCRVMRKRNANVSPLATRSNIETSRVLRSSPRSKQNNSIERPIKNFDMFIDDRTQVVHPSTRGSTTVNNVTMARNTLNTRQTLTSSKTNTLERIDFDDSVFLRTADGGARQSYLPEQHRANTVENNANRPIII